MRKFLIWTINWFKFFFTSFWNGYRTVICILYRSYFVGLRSCGDRSDVTIMRSSGLRCDCSVFLRTRVGYAALVLHLCVYIAPADYPLYTGRSAVVPPCIPVTLSGPSLQSLSGLKTDSSAYRSSFTLIYRGYSCDSSKFRMIRFRFLESPL